MSRSGTAILALIFMVLGTYVYLFEIERETEIKDVEPFNPEKLIEFDPNDVREIIIQKKDGRIVLIKEGDQWKVMEPTPTIARNDRVSDYLLSVFDYGIVREITTNPTPTEMSEYGLDQPEIEMEIKFKGDSPARILLIGSNSPGESCSYGKLKDQSRIVLLGIRYKLDLERDASFYIN